MLEWQQRRYSLVAKRTVESTSPCRGECEDSEYAAGSVLLDGRVKLRSREVEGWKSQRKKKKSEKTPGREKKAERAGQALR